MFQHPFSLLKKTEAEQLLCQQTGHETELHYSESELGRAGTNNRHSYLWPGLRPPLLRVTLRYTEYYTECY